MPKVVVGSTKLPVITQPTPSSLSFGNANDRISGTPGDDKINGGGGIDTAVYLGSINDFTSSSFAWSGSTLTVRGGAKNGTDQLTNVEFLEIGGQKISVNGTIAKSDTVAATEDQPISINALANDFSLKADAKLSYIRADLKGTAKEGDVVAKSDDGVLTLGASGNLVFTPSQKYQMLGEGDQGVAKFNYTIWNGTYDAYGKPAYSTTSLSINITGTNDAALIMGVATGKLTEESTATVSGTLTVLDIDAGESRFQAPASLEGKYGTFTFNVSTGKWTYKLDQAKAQSLNEGVTTNDTLTVKSLDGTAKSIVVTVTGAQDKATISANASDTDVKEDEGGVASGTLTVSDVDTGEGQFQEPKTLDGQFGVFTFDPKTGAWTYTLNDSNEMVNALSEGEVKYDSLTVASKDGHATHQIVVKITGSDDKTATVSDPSKLAAVSGTVEEVILDTNASMTVAQDLPEGVVKITVTGEGAVNLNDNPSDNEFVLEGGSGHRLDFGAGGNDLASGNTATINGISIENFSKGDGINFKDATSIRVLAVRSGSAIVDVDTTGDGKLDATIHLEGEGPDGSKLSLSDFTTDGTVLGFAPKNDAPTGSATATLTGGTEGVAYTVSAADLLQGFTDPEGDALSVTGLASNGGTWANTNGTWTFTPAAGFNGTVDLTYTVEDGNGGSVAGSRSFTLAAVNEVSFTTVPASVSEGAAAQNIVFTRTGDLSKSLTIQVQVAGDSTAGQDHNVATTVVFAAGSSTAALPIQALNDLSIETGENIQITIVPGAGYNVAAGSAAARTIDIVDTTPLPVVTFAVSASVEEGTSADVVFTRTGDASQALDIEVEVNGSKSAVTFLANEITAMLTLSPAPDNVVETSETYDLKLVDGANYNVDPAQASMTVQVNDKTVLARNVEILGTSTEDQELTYTFASNNPADQVESVRWLVDGEVVGTGNAFTPGDAHVNKLPQLEVTLVGGTVLAIVSANSAVANVDDAATGSLGIVGTSEVGQLLSANLGNVADNDGFDANSVDIVWQSFKSGEWVNVAGDTYIPTSQDTSVRAVGTFTDAHGKTQIVYSDEYAVAAAALNTVTVSDANGATEGDGKKVTFTFERTGYLGDELTIEYTYNGADQIVTFAKDAKFAVVEFSVANDEVYLGDREASVELLEGSRYELGAAKSATVQVVEDDQPVPPGIRVNKYWANVSEDGQTDIVEVVLTSRPAADLTVQVGTDPNLKLDVTSVTFTPKDWNAPKQIVVSAVDDLDYEYGDHSAMIYFSPAVSADPSYNGQEVGDEWGAWPIVDATIQDNDVQPNMAPSAMPVAADVYDIDQGVNFAGSGYDNEDTSFVTYEIVSQPKEGTVTLLDDGVTFRFEGNSELLAALSRGEIKPVTFQYRVLDSEGLASDPATVTVNVHGTNPGDESIQAFTCTTFSQTDFFPLDGKDGTDTVVFSNVTLTSGTGLEISLGKTIKGTQYAGKPIANIENITLNGTNGTAGRTLTVGGDDQVNVINIMNTSHKLTINGLAGNDTINFKGSNAAAATSIINGGTGDDAVTLASGAVVKVGEGNDRVNVEAGNVTVQNFSLGDVLNFVGVQASNVTVGVSGGNTVFTITQNGVVTSTVTVEGVTGLQQGTHWVAGAAHPAANIGSATASEAAGSCLVAERCWDQVRFALEEHAWRFEHRRELPSSRRR